MKILNNISLKDFTTIKIGGYTENFFIPESNEELNYLVKELEDDFYVLGNGSNLLINDERTLKNVIYMKDLDKTISMISPGKYYVGASVSLQKLINDINEDGYGGIEYLFSVPGLVGGSVVMNAGRGKPYNKNIGDFVESVHIIDSKGYRILNKSGCEFNYRSSYFKNKSLIITGVTFKFNPISLDESSTLKRERLGFVNKIQDRSGANFGSVFCENNWNIMKGLKLIHPGFKNGVKFSSKTPNWLINEGDGTFKQAIKLIELTIKIHKIFGREAKPEVIIWR